MSKPDLETRFMNSSRKGSSFERAICTKLSLWWSENQNDAIFWRTSQSGGRATIRRSKGRKTTNQHGDICSVDPIGIPFTELIHLELKKGYNRFTPFDLVDRNKKSTPKWLEWIERADSCSKEVGNFTWMVMGHRDQKRSICLFPYLLLSKLFKAGAFTKFPVPHALVVTIVNKEPATLVVMLLDSFLRGASPNHVKKVHREWKASFQSG